LRKLKETRGEVALWEGGGGSELNLKRTNCSTSIHEVTQGADGSIKEWKVAKGIKNGKKKKTERCWRGKKTGAPPGTPEQRWFYRGHAKK